jgi:hypothetical protein
MRWREFITLVGRCRGSLAAGCAGAAGGAAGDRIPKYWFGRFRHLSCNPFPAGAD